MSVVEWRLSQSKIAKDDHILCTAILMTAEPMATARIVLQKYRSIAYLDSAAKLAILFVSLYWNLNKDQVQRLGYVCLLLSPKTVIAQKSALPRLPQH